MPIPTELVGSLPRPEKLQNAYEDYDQGKIQFSDLQAEQDKAAEDSIKRLEATGEPVVTDGEQRESSFATYSITDTLAGTGLADHLAGDGQFFAIFDDGHHRQLPRITGGPFHYKTYASEFVKKNRAIATHDVKQAVIAASMMMLLYPLDGEVDGYPRDAFLDDVVDEVEKDIRQCFDAGAVRVSVDFTEGRLANKNDSRNPWTGKDMLQEFIDLNNRVFARFSADERRNIGVHTCPGGDMDSVHSKEVPYEKLLSKMFQLNAGYFLIQCASEDDKEEVYRLVGQYSRDDADGVPQVCFMGVINPLTPEVETRRAGQERPRHRGQAHPGATPRRHRRLRLLTLQPRSEAQAWLAGLRPRRRDAEDHRTPRRRTHGLRRAGRLGRGGHFPAGRRGRVERQAGGTGGERQVAVAAAVERPGPVAEQARGHGGAADVDGVVVAQPAGEPVQVAGVAADGLVAQRHDVGHGRRPAVADLVQDALELGGDLVAAGARAQLRGAQGELGARGGVGAEGELVVEGVAVPAGA